MKGRWLILAFMVLAAVFVTNAAATTRCTQVLGPDPNPQNGAPSAPFNATFNNFTPFSFTTNFLQDVATCDPLRDFWLFSVNYGNQTRSDFMLASSAQVLDEVYGPTGGRDPNCIISTGRGPNATVGLIAGCVDGHQLLQAYNNLNLSSINFNRELGTTQPLSPGDVAFIPPIQPVPSSPNALSVARFTLSFPQPTDRFLIYERGMDSDIRIAALDSSGNSIATAYIPRPKLDQKAFANSTMDLTKATEQFSGVTVYTRTSGGWAVGPQSLGSVGLKLTEGVTSDTLYIWMYPNPDFGPDYKIIALAPENPQEKFNLVLCPENYPTGSTVLPETGGYVIFNKQHFGGDRKVEVTANLSGVTPNTTYTLYLFVDGNWPDHSLGTITTDASGNGSFCGTAYLPQGFPMGPHYLALDVLNLSAGSPYNDVYETPGLHSNKGAIAQIGQLFDFWKKDDHR